ncbi:MAG: SLBB domain-containing protein [Collinsella sp.]
MADKLLGHKAVVMAIPGRHCDVERLAMAQPWRPVPAPCRLSALTVGPLVVPGPVMPERKHPEGSRLCASAAAEVYVDVDGAVVSPGVYRLKDGARVAQAIDAAGGWRPRQTLRGSIGHPRSSMDKKSTFHGGEQAPIAEADVADGGASASSGVE